MKPRTDSFSVRLAVAGLVLSLFLAFCLTGPAIAFSPPPPDACFADDWAPPPPPPERVRGVAFVHGTSSQTQYTAHYEYWTDPMIQSVRQGLDDPFNYTVVACDFEQNLWHPEMARCLANQLNDFIDSDINDLVVYTHSHGGNALRWILSNPSLDPSFVSIIEDISLTTIIAPSSLGTPLANLAISGTGLTQWLGTLLDFDNDATAQQQTFTMDYLNQVFFLGTQGRPPLPISFWTLTGTDVTTKQPRCAEKKTVAGLHITHRLIKYTGWGECNDGFLPCVSQRGAGIPWADDKEVTNNGREHNHDVSRRDCFGLDIQLRNDLPLN